MAALEHLRLADISDREILLTLIDIANDDPADNDGWVDGPDIAQRLGMKGERPGRCVATRMSWLQRYGAVERELLYDANGNPITNRNTGEHKRGQRWRPTEVGHAVASGAMKKSQQNALDAMDDAQLLLTARFVADAARGSSGAGAKMIEREWKHRWTATNGWVRP
jgi:hypothetical protein